jgi:hypothetical protein
MKQPKPFSSSSDLLKKVTSSSNTKDAVRKLVKNIRSRAVEKGFSGGVIAPPYSPRKFAELLGATTIRSADLESAGRIVIEGTETIVEFQSSSAGTNHQRFILAHEVGHLAIWDAEKQLIANAKPRKTRSRMVERLCNEIATELLAPYEEVREDWKSVCRLARAKGTTPNPVKTIQDISDEYRISLHMAALRFTEVCDRRVGVGLLDVQARLLVWCFSIPGRAALLRFLLDHFKRHQLADSGPFVGAGSYWATVRGDVRLIPVQWHPLHANKDLCLVVVHR